MTRPYTLWAAAFLGTLLAALFAAGHVLATLKHVTNPQVLLRGPTPRHHEWVTNDIAMQLSTNDLHDPALESALLAGGLFNETDWEASPPPVGTTNDLHRPDAMHTGYVALAGDHLVHAEQYLQHILQTASYAETSLGDGSAHTRGGWGGAAEEEASWRSPCTSDDREPATLRAVVYA